MTTTAPPGPPLSSTPADPTSGSLSWEGDKMFNIYIYDYCYKRGFRKTARELLLEADIPPDSTPPINARQGLLFEWWSVFWVLFTAKANGNGPEDAMIYTQYQAQQAANRQRQAQGAAMGPQGPQTGIPQQPMRMNGMAPNQPRFQPNGPIPNGVGPGGIAPGSLPPGAPGFPIGGASGQQINGIPGPQGPPTAPNFQPMMPGQRPPQQRGVVNGGPPFHTDPSSQNPGQPTNQLPQQGQPQQNMNRMLPPNGIPPQAQPPNSSYPPIGRPPSRTATPSGMMTTQSPSMMNRQPPQDINLEWQKIPPQALMVLKAEVGLEGKDLMAFTLEDKQRVLHHHRQKSSRNQQKPGPPNATAGPSNAMLPPNQQRGAPPGRTAAKRNSTSPGDEQEANNTSGSSPPERKRVRRSPMDQAMGTPMNYPQIPPQQQPPPPGGPQQMNGPMGRMPGGPPPQNGFNPGMPPGMMNPMMQLGQNQLGGPMGGMSPAMGGLPNQGMMNPQMPIHGMQPRDPNQQYRQSIQMHNRGMMPPGQPGMMTNAGSPAADPGFNPGGPGGPPNRMGGPPGPQQKPMGMLPPPSPGMGKDQQGGNKDIKAEASPNNMPESIQGSGTGPATPVTATNPALDTSALFPMGNDMLLSSQDFVNTIASGLDDFDPSTMFGRSDGVVGDINFERDFGQWFNNPDDSLTGTLDLSK